MKALIIWAFWQPSRLYHYIKWSFQEMSLSMGQMTMQEKSFVRC